MLSGSFLVPCPMSFMGGMVSEQGRGRVSGSKVWRMYPTPKIEPT